MQSVNAVTRCQTIGSNVCRKEIVGHDAQVTQSWDVQASSAAGVLYSCTLVQTVDTQQSRHADRFGKFEATRKQVLTCDLGRKMCRAPATETRGQALSAASIQQGGM